MGVGADPGEVAKVVSGEMGIAVDPEEKWGEEEVVADPGEGAGEMGFAADLGGMGR